ncbi:hypothetical protein VST7929_02991 [Vibrio stylophorae]|uniref:Uncharacterized protein n=1 Tax=Vibrio stylophorae TaxID=659351 RepID=A0ABM8ZXP3_9VIBR|nr:hypothetical protein [Vibrio stylophorae]CAH0535418.1 hypothetical protein VST7929_02991 [Vibrio stylophorae]
MNSITYLNAGFGINPQQAHKLNQLVAQFQNIHQPLSASALSDVKSLNANERALLVTQIDEQSVGGQLLIALMQSRGNDDINRALEGLQGQSLSHCIAPYLGANIEIAALAKPAPKDKADEKTKVASRFKPWQALQWSDQLDAVPSPLKQRIKLLLLILNKVK